MNAVCECRDADYAAELGFKVVQGDFRGRAADSCSFYVFEDAHNFSIIEILSGMDQDGLADDFLRNLPCAVFNILDAVDDEPCPWLADGYAGIFRHPTPPASPYAGNKKGPVPDLHPWRGNIHFRDFAALSQGT